MNPDISGIGRGEPFMMLHVMSPKAAPIAPYGPSSNPEANINPICGFNPSP